MRKPGRPKDLTQALPDRACPRGPGGVCFSQRKERGEREWNRKNGAYWGGGGWPGCCSMALGAVLAGLSRAMGGPVLLELLSGIFMGLSVGTLLAGLLTVLHAFR